MKRGRSLLRIAALLVALFAGPTMILRRDGTPAREHIPDLVGEQERLLDAPGPLPAGTTGQYRY